MKHNIKTILFISLIVAMVLPFSGMNMVYAEEDKTVVDWSNEQKISKDDLRIQGLITEGVNNLSSVYVYCNHEASIDNKCYGWDNDGDFYYSIPYAYKNVDTCGRYTCVDLDYYHRGDRQISSNGYQYTFKSSSYYACATELGLCTSPLQSTNNFERIHHNNIPTSEPINHITTYKYERHGQTITFLVVQLMTQGYS